MIIENHFIPSSPVISWFAIKDIAEEIGEYIDAKGGMFALHHSQVSDKPLNFFVLETNVLKEWIPELGSRYIINPVIVNSNLSTVRKIHEGCMSFPHKKPKRVDRAMVVTVKYQVPDETKPNGLVDKTKEVSMLVAQIFQHECDHSLGKNIFYDTPKKI